MMMGRGLVHPVDLHHSENPPADAELLELMAGEFLAMRYDIKAFLRELALTRVYQRTSEPPDGASPGDDSGGGSSFVVACLKTETPEQLAWSVMQGLGAGRPDASSGRGKAGRARPQNAGDFSDRRPAAGAAGDDDRGAGA